MLIALYENATPFEARMVDRMTPEPRAACLALWPLGKMPVLRDEAGNQTFPETSIIIDYLDQHYPGARPLLPRDPDAQLEARLWDRLIDLYIHASMNARVNDRLRPEEKRDAISVAKANETFDIAYGLFERQLQGKTWVTGEAFTIADCAAAPALFYAEAIHPFSKSHPLIAAYFERLLARPSYARVLTEARPFLQYFPFKENLAARYFEG